MEAQLDTPEGALAYAIRLCSEQIDVAEAIGGKESLVRVATLAVRFVREDLQSALRRITEAKP